MEDFLLIIVIWFAGYVTGWWSHSRLIRALLSRALEDTEDDEPVKLRVERHGDAIYLYREDTNEFLAQGATLQEALDLVEKRFPNEQFKGLLSKEQVDELGIKI
jgi:hypothetical protein